MARASPKRTSTPSSRSSSTLSLTWGSAAGGRAWKISSHFSATCPSLTRMRMGSSRRNSPVSPYSSCTRSPSSLMPGRSSLTPRTSRPVRR